MMLKPLLPSLREKKRYVAFSINSTQPVQYDAVVNEIKMTLQEFIGYIGMAKAGLIFLKDWKHQRGIARIHPAYVDYFRGALALVPNIHGQQGNIQSLGISGTLKKLRKLYFTGGN